MSYKSEILELHNERYPLLDQLNELEEDASVQLKNELNQKIDALANQILDIIKQFINELEFDFVMQQLSFLGQCPNLLNDDNGHWAIVCDGFQNIAYGDETQDIETYFFVDAKQWKSTIQEALIEYLKDKE